jgi:hypothetical protein
LSKSCLPKKELLKIIKTKENTALMRTMKQVLEGTIDHLNSYSPEYFFEFNDIQLPLPASAEEAHYELCITRTGRENGKRERLVHFTYSWRFFIPS